MQVVLGLFFTILSLFVIAASQKRDDEASIASVANAHLMEDESEGEYVSDPQNKKSPEETHAFAVSNASIIFQMLLILASCYYAMLMTNWGDPTLYDETVDFF
mmetsp:Transcript_16315/g.22367  ORF Transcript_16315/g.22367 Transcript_16315/m.22367 type:complete len:103 (+) Transcript_16315:883-1191(+)